MPAYIIAEIQVTDPTAYEGYRPLAAASVARYGGRFAVRGGNIDLLDGSPRRLITSSPNLLHSSSKAAPSRSGSSSSNFRMRMPPAAGTARRNIRKR